MHETLGHALLNRLAGSAFALCRTCSGLQACLCLGALPLHGRDAAGGAQMLHNLVQSRVQSRAQGGAHGRECFLLVEYALPERNLHFSTVWLRVLLENIAGTGHGAHYRAFMQAGGLEGALARSGIRVLERRSLGLGVLTQVRCAGNGAGPG